MAKVDCARFMRQVEMKPTIVYGIFELDHQFHVSLLGDVLAGVLPDIVN